MGEKLKTAAEICLDQKAYQEWAQSDRGCSREEIEKARTMLPFAIQTCLSDKQRTYIMEYLVNELTVSEIGEKYGVNKATVSRTMNRGLNRLYDHLQFVSPYFCGKDLRKTVSLGKNKRNKDKRKPKR